MSVFNTFERQYNTADYSSQYAMRVQIMTEFIKMITTTTMDGTSVVTNQFGNIVFGEPTSTSSGDMLTYYPYGQVNPDHKKQKAIYIDRTANENTYARFAIYYKWSPSKYLILFRKAMPWPKYNVPGAWGLLLYHDISTGITFDHTPSANSGSNQTDLYYDPKMSEESQSYVVRNLNNFFTSSIFRPYSWPSSIKYYSDEELEEDSKKVNSVILRPLIGKSNYFNTIKDVNLTVSNTGFFDITYQTKSDGTIDHDFWAEDWYTTYAEHPKSHVRYYIIPIEKGSAGVTTVFVYN